MVDEKETISKAEAYRQIRLGLRRLALLYRYFAETAIEHLGEDEGAEFMRRAISAYGEHIGREAKEKAIRKGLPLVPENFASDLPDMAWESETVKVEGEARVRIHRCPLAADWLDMGDFQLGRLYCSVDQAKMRAFNPDYEFIHFKKILEGDSFCEMTVRTKGSDQDK